MGDVIAMYNLGHCYEHGNGVKEDKQKAIELYQRASDMGHAGAMYNLDYCYEHGDCVKEDKQKAIELYQRDSDMGDVKPLRAQTEL